jgi:hypothetical protein
MIGKSLPDKGRMRNYNRFANGPSGLAQRKQERVRMAMEKARL